MHPTFACPPHQVTFFIPKYICHPPQQYSKHSHNSSAVPDDPLSATFNAVSSVTPQFHIIILNLLNNFNSLNIVPPPQQFHMTTLSNLSMFNTMNTTTPAILYHNIPLRSIALCNALNTVIPAILYHNSSPFSTALFNRMNTMLPQQFHITSNVQFNNNVTPAFFLIAELLHLP